MADRLRHLIVRGPNNNATLRILVWWPDSDMAKDGALELGQFRSANFLDEFLLRVLSRVVGFR